MFFLRHSHPTVSNKSLQTAQGYLILRGEAGVRSRWHVCAMEAVLRCCTGVSPAPWGPAPWKPWQSVLGGQCGDEGLWNPWLIVTDLIQEEENFHFH